MKVNCSLLHIGCGSEPLPEWAICDEEIRLDIDPNVNPDIVASMTDLGLIGQYDIVYSCHSLEHLYPHDVKKALKEFLRVLSDGGWAIVIVPNIEGVKPNKETIYVSDGGPVCGLDVLFGMASLVENNPHMAHRTGFTNELLIEEFKEAGFNEVHGKVLDKIHSIMVCGKKLENYNV